VALAVACQTCYCFKNQCGLFCAFFEKLYFFYHHLWRHIGAKINAHIMVLGGLLAFLFSTWVALAEALLDKRFSLQLGGDLFLINSYKN
jgi:hypothetical protein